MNQRVIVAISGGKSSAWCADFVLKCLKEQLYDFYKSGEQMEYRIINEWVYPNGDCTPIPAYCVQIKAGFFSVWKNLKWFQHKRDAKEFKDSLEHK